MPRWRWFVGAAFWLLMCRTASAAPELEWESSWRRVGVIEYAVTGALLSEYVIVRFLVPPSDGALWSSELPMDGPARDTLRLSTRRARRTADIVSDGLDYGLLAHSLVLDPWFVAGAAHENGDVGFQLFVIGLGSHSASLALTATVKRLTRRQRPLSLFCQKDSNYAPECGTEAEYRSFFSNHAASTATSAGLICAHHTALPLYGGGMADAAACVVACSMAVTTGILRVASEQHWLSDVLAAQAIGATLGFVLPTLIYYDNDPEASGSGVQQPGTAPAPVFLNWATVF